MMSKTQKQNHDDTIIKTSGAYKIDDALYAHEEYPDDFESESGDEQAE